MKDIHLYSHRSYEPEPNGNSRTVQFMYGIAFLILFIAWINYINLSTAKAMERAREVGVRKVMGSFRGQLVFQFLSESFIISLLATVLALVAIYILWPSFVRLSGVPLSEHQLFTLPFWKLIARITIAGALIAGIYPAFVLSSFKPVQVLKGKFQSTLHGQWLRKGLVVFQFASAVLLIITLSTVFLQMNHLKRQDLGMSIDQVLALRTPSLYYDSIYLTKTDLFKNDLTQQAAVLKMGKSGGALPGMDMQELSSTSSFYREGDTKKTGFVYYITSLDEDLAEALDFKFAAGRNFNKEEKGVILNEVAIRLLGFSNAEQAIGSNVVLYDEQQTIIGVLNNFHQRSPKESHIPMVFRYSAYADYFAIRFKPDQVDEIINVAKKSWNKAYPGSPFEYEFLDERFNEQYKSDQQFEKVVGLFSILAAFIACLGLFGLSLFTILQRMKEIGIRKVLGASVMQVVGLLSRDFIQLVVIASVIAIPLAYLLMQDWLSSFATHVSLTVWMFVVPAVTVLIISFITVSFQTIRAAQSNPANTLKNE